MDFIDEDINPSPTSEIDYDDDELDEAVYSEEEVDYQDDEDDNYYPDSESKREKQRVLSEAELRKLMEDSIEEVSLVLSIPKDMASILLRYFRWSVTEVTDSWFSDEFKVRKKVGLLLKEQEIHSIPDESITCGICFESYSRDDLSWDKCGHPFCNDCWAGYISNYVKEGAGPLMIIRCPEPSCRAALRHQLFDKIATEDQKQRFLSFLVKSFVENNKNIQWCPANGCEYAIQLDVYANTSSDVTCLCSHNFCWMCKDEAHRPMGCDIVAKWNEKTSNSEERTNHRIMLWTKPCPQCNRPIEKNYGCMQMKCKALCGYQFCWICLQKWQVHFNFYGCNCFSEIAAKNLKEKESKKKYLHCFDRWEAHGVSRGQAVKDLEKLKSEQIKKLCDVQEQVGSHMEFLVEAWKQIIKCRQILRWTYAHRYFLPDNELGKIQLFEFLQGRAESVVERLHSCTEIGVGKFLAADGLSERFDEFWEKLIELTGVTRNYFENLVNSMENGLSFVVSIPVEPLRKAKLD